MRRLLFCALIFLSAFYTQAQTGSIKGRIADTTNKQHLFQATVSVLNPLDSSVVAFTLTDNKGAFEIKDLPEGQHLVVMSFAGYGEISRKITIDRTNRNVDLGEVVLQKDFKTLANVTVTDLAPIKIKDDTISFRADAFKTRPNATAEDLLKKLPGVQVGKDGTVTAMGETVQKVYVDGKEFFGNDPKVATKNITAEMVDQVQVFDDMSEQSKFTKVDDGSRTKAINLKLKKDKNKGYFGKVLAGAGNEQRYEGSAALNYFKGDKRISILAAANNINKQSFTFSDIISAMGGLKSLVKGGESFSGLDNLMSLSGVGGRGPGLTDSKGGGINYADHWGKVDFQGSYLFTQSINDLLQNTFRQNYFPGDSLSTTFLDHASRNKNKNHRVNGRWEYGLDSLTSVLYIINLNLQRSDSRYFDTSSVYSDAINDYLAITSNTANTTERDGINYSGELLLRRKFAKVGRTLTLGWRNGFFESEGEGFNRSPFTYFKPDGDIFFSRLQDYVSGHATRTNNNNVSLTYTEPVSKQSFFEFNYSYSHNKNTSDKRTYDYNSFTDKYDQLNLLLTNYFENANRINRFGVNYREQQKKYNFQLGAAVQSSILLNRSIQALTNKDTTIRQRFIDFFPTALINFTKNRAKTFQLNYRGRTVTPSAAQLQDVPDVTNPLHIRIGNPLLKQEFNHSLSLNYNTFQLLKFRFFAVNLTYNRTSNKISNSIDSIDRATTITMPVNRNGNYGLSGFMTIGFPIKKLSGSQFNSMTMVSQHRNVSLLYKQRNYTTTLLVSQNFNFNYNYKKIDAGLSAGLSYNRTRYELQPDLNNNFFTQTYSADLAYDIFKNGLLGTDIDVMINTGRSDGFNQTIPMWNMFAAFQFLKKKNAELKFTVYDILNQNKSVNRYTGENYLTDTRSNVLRRFFMISFSYSLNSMGGKQESLPPVLEKMMNKGSRMRF